MSNRYTTDWKEDQLCGFTLDYAWEHNVDKRDRKGLSFFDLQANLTPDGVKIAVYKAFRSTCQRHLKGVADRINTGDLQGGDPTWLADLQECMIRLKIADSRKLAKYQELGALRIMEDISELAAETPDGR